MLKAMKIVLNLCYSYDIIITIRPHLEPRSSNCYLGLLLTLEHTLHGEKYRAFRILSIA